MVNRSPFRRASEVPAFWISLLRLRAPAAALVAGAGAKHQWNLTHRFAGRTSFGRRPQSRDSDRSRAPAASPGRTDQRRGTLLSLGGARRDLPPPGWSRPGGTGRNDLRRPLPVVFAGRRAGGAIGPGR